MQHVLLMQRTGECIAASFKKFIWKVKSVSVAPPAMPSPDATVSKKSTKTTGTGTGTGKTRRTGESDADAKSAGPATKKRNSKSVPKDALLALTTALVSRGVIQNHGGDSLYQLDIGLRDLLTGRWIERPKVSTLRGRQRASESQLSS